MFAAPTMIEEKNMLVSVYDLVYKYRGELDTAKANEIVEKVIQVVLYDRFAGMNLGGAQALLQNVKDFVLPVIPVSEPKLPKFYEKFALMGLRGELV